MELTPEIVKALEYLARVERPPLCPNCAKRPQDTASENGWCARCDADRERTLESKRRWWRENGAEWRRARSRPA